jgi:hypothetical protein
MEDENETHYTPRMDYLAMRKLSIIPNKLKKNTPSRSDEEMLISDFSTKACKI